MENLIIGIDLGGTNLRIGAVSEANKVYHQRVIGSGRLSEVENASDELGKIIEDYIAKHCISGICAISIGVPSSVAADKETVICTTNIRNQRDEPVFYHTNLAKSLRQRFQLPVFINNDTNNILRYDVHQYHLEAQSVIAGIYIGTGVGASVLIDGRSYTGADGAALDLGHIPYYQETDTCSCGKRGCCECYASGWRLQKIRQQYYPQTDIHELFLKHKEEQPMKEFLYSCSHVFSIMATIFNPSTIVLGGGVIEMPDFPKKLFEQLVNENTGKDVMAYGFDYVYSKAYPGKGVIGAALFARKMLRATETC